MQPLSPIEEFERVDYVFSWKVTNFENSWKYEKEANFSIETFYKWEYLDNNVSVFTPESSASCWVYFEEGEEYIIYANKDDEDKNIKTYLCSRTAKLADASTDVSELEDKSFEPTFPSEENQPQEDSINKTNFNYYFLIFPLILIVMFFVINKKDQ